MKRFIIATLAAIFCFNTCFGADLDYASMSDAELHQVLDLARNELSAREARQSPSLIAYDGNGIQIAFIGTFEYGSATGNLYLDMTVANNSETPISLTNGKCYINGWDVSSSTQGARDLAPGKKTKFQLSVGLLDAFVESIADIEDFVFNLEVFDPNTYSTIFTTPDIEVYTSADGVIGAQEIYDIG